MLQKIYQEFFLLFQIDSFHMGSEEVSFECWNSSRLITDQMATRSNMQSRSNNGEWMQRSLVYQTVPVVAIHLATRCQMV